MKTLTGIVLFWSFIFTSATCSSPEGTYTQPTNNEKTQVGGVNEPCLAGTNGQSTMGCNAGLACCGGTCYNLDNTVAHCGECRNSCPEGNTCVDGQCNCPEWTTDCGGTCVLTAAFEMDESNCGGCDQLCAVGEACGKGVCGKPCTLMQDCPGGQVCVGQFIGLDKVNGSCQIVDCTSDLDCLPLDPTGSYVPSKLFPPDELMQCCGGHCSATISDPDNCGSCGTNVCDYQCYWHINPYVLATCNMCGGSKHNGDWWGPNLCYLGACDPPLFDDAVTPGYFRVKNCLLQP